MIRRINGLGDLATFLFVVLAMAGVCCVSACDTKSESAASDKQPARGEPTGVYTVRGVIVSLPDPQRPGSGGTGGSDLQIRHERIPEFKDASGAEIGMNAMIMPFPLAKGVTLDGLAVDDRVEFTFAAWMQPGQRGWELRTIQKLPSDTPLDFTAAGPAPLQPAPVQPASGDAPTTPPGK